MSPASQLFKLQYPYSKFKEFIDKTCLKTDRENVYIFTKICFKRGVYNNIIQSFYDDILPYYHLSKKRYADKTNITYKSVINILRQLCRSHSISIESNIKYEKSSYELEYIINMNLPIVDISNSKLPNENNKDIVKEEEPEQLTEQEQSILKLLNLLLEVDS